MNLEQLVSTPIMDFFKQNSPPEITLGPIDKKLKRTSSDEFVPKLQAISEEYARLSPLILANVGGSDAILSLYALLGKDSRRKKPNLIVIDRKDTNLQNMFFRLMLAQLNPASIDDYVRDMFDVESEYSSKSKAAILSQAGLKEHLLETKYDPESHFKRLMKKAEGLKNKELVTMFEKIAKNMTEYFGSTDNYNLFVKEFFAMYEESRKVHYLSSKSTYRAIVKALDFEKNQFHIHFMSGDISTQAGVEAVKKVLSNYDLDSNGAPFDLAFIPHYQRDMPHLTAFIKKHVGEIIYSTFNPEKERKEWVSKKLGQHPISILFEEFVPAEDLDSKVLIALANKEKGSFTGIERVIVDDQPYEIVKSEFPKPGKVAKKFITLEPAYIPQHNPMSVYTLFNIYFDSIMFNEKAWKNVLKFLSAAKPDALVFSGALMRLDRPEYKIDDLVYFNQEYSELEETYRQARNNGGEESPYDPLAGPPSQWMSREFDILNKRMEELRKALPDTSIDYTLGSDDGFTINRVIHKIALERTARLITAASNAKKEKKEKSKELEEGETEYKKILEKLTNYDKQSEELKKELEGAERRINYLAQSKKPSRELKTLRTKKTAINRQLKEMKKEMEEYGGKSKEKNTALADLYTSHQRIVDDLEALQDLRRWNRPRKENPGHQTSVHEGTELVLGKYASVFNKYKIHMHFGKDDIKINGNLTSFGANGRLFETPIKFRGRELFEEVQKAADKLAGQGYVLIAEGGGTYWVHRIDTTATIDAINQLDEGEWFQGAFPKTFHAAVLPVFHDQDVVKEIMDGKYPDRLSAKKAVGNRSHDSVTIYNNGGVSGLAGFFIDEEGMPGRMIIPYFVFKHGKRQMPKEWWQVSTQGDTHLCYAYSAMDLISGAQVRRRLDYENNGQRALFDSPIHIGALIGIGDETEANSAGWRGAGAEFRRYMPNELVDFVANLIANPPPTIDEKIWHWSRYMALSIMGARENIGDVLRVIADYFMPDIKTLAKISPLKTVFSDVGTNHTFLTLRGSGINPFEILIDRIDDAGLAERVKIDQRDARSNAKGILLGPKINDKPSSLGPIRILNIHDPPKIIDAPYAALMAGSNMNFPLTTSGHFHMVGEAGGRYMGIPNTIAIGSTSGHLQRTVTSTGLFYAGAPHHQGTKVLYLPARQFHNYSFLGINPSLEQEGKIPLEMIVITEQLPEMLSQQSRKYVSLSIKAQGLPLEYRPDFKLPYSVAVGMQAIAEKPINEIPQFR